MWSTCILANACFVISSSNVRWPLGKCRSKSGCCGTRDVLCGYFNSFYVGILARCFAFVNWITLL